MMDLNQVPATDVRPLLSRDRADLLDLLRTLSSQQWDAASDAPGWSVKDLALHLLDDDLGLLSRSRDRDHSSFLAMDDHETFVAALAAKNERWIDGTRGLSARLITELLDWSGGQLDAYYASVDLLSEGYVSWASDGPVPFWLDMARELTERWVHQMQMREAVGRVDDYAVRYLAIVLRTFVWALPQQYRVHAPTATTVQVDLSSGGTWQLMSDGASRWSLAECTTEKPDARAHFSDDAGWRWLTGAVVSSEGVRLEGPPDLCEPLLDVRGIIV